MARGMPKVTVRYDDDDPQEAVKTAITMYGQTVETLRRSGLDNSGA